MTDSQIKFTRRETKTGFNYFILNQGDKAFDGWLPFQINVSSAAIFNPTTDKFGLAKSRIKSGRETEIYVRLLPGESLIITGYKEPVSGKPYSFYDPLTTSKEITGTWKVDFIEGGPALPASSEISKLISWTEFSKDGVKDFSGTAKYSISFTKPSGKADAWLLNLGKICESARVTLNGKEIAVLIGPDFQVIIDKKELKKQNTLEIKVSNLMANRIAYMDRNNIEWKKFYNANIAARIRENSKNGIFDASSWKPRESGLIGLVTIAPLKLVK
jgi:hypothetical protein